MPSTYILHTFIFDAISPNHIVKGLIGQKPIACWGQFERRLQRIHGFSGQLLSCHMRAYCQSQLPPCHWGEHRWANNPVWIIFSFSFTETHTTACTITPLGNGLFYGFTITRSWVIQPRLHRLRIESHWLFNNNRYSLTRLSVVLWEEEHTYTRHNNNIMSIFAFAIQPHSRSFIINIHGCRFVGIIASLPHHTHREMEQPTTSTVSIFPSYNIITAWIIQLKQQPYIFHITAVCC